MKIENIGFVKIIARGGFGETALVVDKTTGKTFIRKESLYNDTIGMLYQYNMLKYLKDKHICQEYFICPVKKYVHDGKTFILFDYLDGYQDLQNIRLHYKIKSMNDKIKICKKLIRAVRLLHRSNMVHVDIQPLNIMIHPETKDVRIIDFGTAIIHTGREMYDKNRPVDPFSVSPSFHIDEKKTFGEFKKNDMWALGNVIYLFLFNKYPFLRTEKQVEQANSKLQHTLHNQTIVFFHKELGNFKQLQKKKQQTSSQKKQNKVLPFLDSIEKKQQASSQKKQNKVLPFLDSIKKK